MQIYVTAPYYENGKYNLEKPLVVLAAFEKTGLIAPGETETVTLTWNARDIACDPDTAACYVLERGQLSVPGVHKCRHCPSCSRGGAELVLPR